MKTTSPSQAIEDRPKATMRLTVPKEHRKYYPADPVHRVGKRATVTLHGKVISLSDDEHGHSMEMELLPE